MTVTSKLLNLYRVDQQLRGIKGRLRKAEAYLRQQDAKLSEIKQDHERVHGELQQAEASMHNDELEMKSFDERIETIRERMNTAQTSKEHSALLTEMNTIKADRDQIEERTMGLLTKIEKLREEKAGMDETLAEREKIRLVAVEDRDANQAEIADRAAELESERAEVAGDVPASALEQYNELMERGFEDVMAPVEAAEGRAMEFTCGSCFTHLPIETVSNLINSGDITICPTCHVLLYVSSELKETVMSSKPNARTRSVSSAD